MFSIVGRVLMYVFSGMVARRAQTAVNRRVGGQQGGIKGILFGLAVTYVINRLFGGRRRTTRV